MNTIMQSFSQPFQLREGIDYIEDLTEDLWWSNTTGDSNSKNNLEHSLTGNVEDTLQTWLSRLRWEICG